MIIATTGHINHGKTSLVRALTGVDTDRLPEEKRRGMTIDLGFAYRRFEDDTMLGFVDVPGHARFVHTMVAGVGAVDFALLVVAADDGPMPQTKEHISILSLLGIERGAIVITKIDKTGPDAAAEVVQNVRAIAADGLWRTAPHFAVSSQSGEGIPALLDYLVAEARHVRDRRPTRDFRMTVDRVFTIDGAGLVAGGTVIAGEISAGDPVVVSPQRLPARVRRLHANNRESASARTGDRCALNLVLQKNGEFGRGDWIVAADAIAPTQRFDARLTTLSSVPRSIRSGANVHLCIGTAELMARVDLLAGSSLQPGETGFVQIVTGQAVDVRRADRFILRDRSATITLGGGEVVDPWPPVRGRSRAPRLAILDAMASVTPEGAFAKLLSVSAQGIDWDSFTRAWNLTDGDATELAKSRGIVELSHSKSHILLARDRWDALTKDILRVLRQWHERHPDETGPSRHDVLGAMRASADPWLIEAAVETLLRDGVVKLSRSRLHLAGHEPILLQGDRILWNRLRALYRQQPDRPPTIREIAESFGIDRDKLEPFLDRMARRDYLVRVSENRYFINEQLNELQVLAENLADEAPDRAFAAAAFRDRCKLGRNLTIELLEYFDRIGFTRLVDGKRQIRRRVAMATL